MEADTLVALRSRLACLPGGRTRQQHPILLVTVPAQLQPWTKKHLEICIEYILGILDEESKCEGLAVLVDGQRGSWRLARALIRQTKQLLDQKMSNMIVLRSDAFWAKQRIDHCTKQDKDKEPIYISKSRLSKYVDENNLPVDLGGQYEYNHTQWIQTRLLVDEFSRRAAEALSQLQDVRLHLLESRHTRLCQMSAALSENAGKSEKAEHLAQDVQRAGESLLQQYQSPIIIQPISYSSNSIATDCQQVRMRSPQDFLDTQSRIQRSLEAITTARLQSEEAWLEAEKAYNEAQDVEKLASALDQVTAWIMGPGEKLLNVSQRVGGDSSSAEALLRKHESLELRCRLAYARYAELMRKVDALPVTAKSREDLLTRRDLMDSACRHFAIRIEQRRNALVTSVRFHRLVGEYFSRTDEVYERLLMGVNGENLERDVRDAAQQLKILRKHQSELESLQRALRRAGERLCCTYSGNINPLKTPSVFATSATSPAFQSQQYISSASLYQQSNQTFPRNMPFTSDSTPSFLDVVKVKGALDAAAARGSLFTDGLELRLLTLQQLQHVGSYETEAGRAKEWLDDLVAAVRKEYITVGCNEDEIRVQRDRQTALQKTAESTYKYGKQLLGAAACLRTACRLSSADNTRQCDDLEKAWCVLRAASDEQMTRLRVCAVFHRSTAHQCRRLRELIELASCGTDMDNEQGEKERDQVLQEVGRMVRLGRLLRTRLKEAILIGDEMPSMNEQPNASAIEAISKKLTEVTSLADQLDAALRTAQDSQNENASRSLSSEEACTEDARSESEDFITASECTCTPQSRSSSYHTASECGTSPWLDQELDPTQHHGVTSTPLTSPSHNHQQTTSKLVREITETRTFKVRQCQVASNASLVRTEDELRHKEKKLGEPYDLKEQSGEWITVKLVEAQPDLTSIGNDLQEAVELQTAHREVLRQLKNKATPVEELMRQVDEKVSSQRPEPEVYAAMAESLGTAWQSINRHLEHRKQILDLSVAFQTNFEQCLQRMEVLDALCRDQELPIQIDAVKEALTEIHDLRRSVLESVMAALQEGGHLLDHLKDLNNIGTLDSRPGQIKPSVGSAIKQVENWLEMMHDRRKFLEITWQGRKNRLEQCLALAMLAKDLRELEDAISQHKEQLGTDIYLGESEYETTMLITDICKYIKDIKELQERAIKITRATEQLVKSGCFAGREASDKAYSVLGACSDFLNDLEARETLLTRAQAFYENGRQVLNRLDDFEREVRQNDLVGMLPRLTPVTITNAVDEITHDVIREGKDLLTECGINNPGSQGVRHLLEEIESRTIELRRKCDEMRRTDRKIGEALFEFQERQDELSSWLRMVSEISLKEHRDMGHDLPTAKEFYSFHHELLKELEVKGNEINALLLTLPPILEYLDDEQRKEVDRKVENLHENWTTLKAAVELRLDLSAVFVQFLTDADRLNGEFDTLDRLLIRSSGHSIEDKIKLMDEQWYVIKPMYDQLKNSGTGFKSSAEQRAVGDRHLAIGNACSLIEEILNSFSGREFRLIEQQETWRTQITTVRQVYEEWRSAMEQTRPVIEWITKLDTNLYPVLTSPASNANELLSFTENTLQRVTNEIKEAHNEIENKLHLTEDLVTQDTSLLEETQPVKENLQQLQQKLNTSGTEYKLLVQSIISFLRNVAELDKSIENVQNKSRLPVDLQTDLENFAKDHEASKKIIMEMFKLIVNESDEVINKIRQQEPKLAAQHDIEKILSMLEQRKVSFETSWNATKVALDESLKTGQFDADLKDINGTLDDLVRQLASVRGQYGETLATAKASSLAFEYFERTIELLQNRIDGFISSSNEIFSDNSREYPRIKRDLDALENRWNNFRKEVSEVRRLIDLSIQYFKLVDETDDWFREGNKLLLTIASKTATIKTENDAHNLLSELEQFITGGEDKQNERLSKMSALARELYDDSRYSHLNKIQNANRDMMESFKTMKDNLRTAIENLKKAARERDEVDRSLAEKAKLEAELLVQNTLIQQKIVQTTTSESQTMELGKAPEFIVTLTDAVVPEGSKFTFECQVTGDPEPDISWYKDGMCIENNPDYKTIFENGKCSLTIEETFTEDSAKFKCKASNRYGSVDTIATLSVKETDISTLLQPPQFVEFLKPGKAMEGKSFQFECKVTGNPLPTVQWYKNDVCIDNSSDYAITYNNGEAVLRFEEVFLEDHALYMCKATNDAGIDQCQAYLTVEPLEPTEKPVFIVALSNTMARAGQKVKLECQVSGIPEPQIQWTHNGKPFLETSDAKLHRDGQRATLIINEAFPKDAGLYTATARNLAGAATSSCNVSVKGLLPNETSDSEQPSDMEPIKPSIQMPLKDQSVCERDVVRFDCVIVGQPEPEVIWYHNDKPVKESSEFQLLFQGDRCSLIIREVFSEDAGTYKVVAINSAGEASSTCSLKVDKPKEIPIETIAPVGIPPKFTKLLTDVLVSGNEKVLLECEVTGDPIPDIKWYHNSKELIANEAHDISFNNGLAQLIIHQVQPDDKGIYTVKATNSCGDAKCFAHLIVKSVNVAESQKPAFVQPEIEYTAPTFKELFSDCKVPNGCTAKFECIVTGKPAPKIKWFFNDLPVSGKDFLVSSCGDRQILTIPSVTPELTGNIACVAENEVGKTTCVASLSVDSLQTHHELIMPAFEQNATESKSVYMKQEIITQSSSHSSTLYGDGEPKHEVHQVTSQSHSTAKQINDEPPVVIQTQKIEEYHQTDKEPASAREETLSSTTVDQNTSVKESVTTKIEPVKVFHQVRKSISPRFTSPLVGRIVDKGADIVLECIVDGYPTPEIQWTKNGQPLNVGGNVASITWELNKARIELKNVGIEDAGRYTCTADNSAGVASSTADIVVKKTIFPPVFGRRLQAQVVKKGDRVIMEVEVSGTPEPTVTWHKDSKPLEESMASPYRLKTQGLCHTLIIDKVSLDDSGKYMVRAVNAGGEAQSIADFAVFEPTPDTMVEVVKTMVFEDLQDQSPKKPVTSIIQEPVTCTSSHQPTTSDSSQTMTQMSSQTESVFVTETRQTEQKFKMEHKTSMSLGTDFPTLTQQTQTSHISTVDKKLETEPKLSSGMNTDVALSSDKSTVTEMQPSICSQTDGIQSESISKKSALDFFVSKMQTPAEVPVKPVEFKSPFTPQVSSQSEVWMPKSTDFTTQYKQEYSENLLADYGLEPGPPPEIGYMPKMGQVKKTEDVAHKIKKLQETQKDDIAPPTGGVKLFSIPPTPKEEYKESPLDSFKQEFITQKYEQKAFENKTSSEPIYRPPSDISIKPTSPKPAAEAINMQKLWNRPISPQISANSVTEKSATYWSSDNEYRSFSEMSQTSDKGVPSADGVAMDKIWAHKSQESSLPVAWPPVQPEEEQKVQVITQVKEDKTSSLHYDSIPEQKLHYVAHTTVSEKQNLPTIDSSLISDSFKEESKIYKEFKTEESFSKSMSSSNTWQPTLKEDYTLQAPLMVQKLISKSAEEAILVSEKKDDLSLEPGPEPEMCFAPRTTLQRRQSHVETIEQDLEKALDKVPSRVLPGAVRTIPPPPIPPKDQFIPAPPLPTKPAVELSAFKPFPELEPFPFKPEPEVSKPKCPPPATPSKFVKGEFTESDYESEIENTKIKSIWAPRDTDDNVKGFRRVEAPSSVVKRPISTEPIPVPPTEFEKPLTTFSPSVQKTDVLKQETIKKSTILEKNYKTSEKTQTQSFVSEPILAPGPAPVFVQTEPIKKVKPESPKAKPKFQPESGYMADTEDTLRKFSKITESKTYQYESSNNISSMNVERKSPPIKVYRHHVRADKPSVQPVTPQTKDAMIKNISMTSREIKINEKLEPFPYKPDAAKPKRAACPPPPSPSKFVKGEFRESDYESDYDSRIPAVWRPYESDTDEKAYRPVRVSLTTTKSGRYSRTSDGKSPTPPTEFDKPPEFMGPPRPKFSPIEKIENKTKVSEISKSINKQQIYKPTPVAAKPISQDHIDHAPVRSVVAIQPGPQPEIGYVPPPKRTQYYIGKAGIPVANAVETSKTMHFNESTESSHRVLNISQTTRVIKFGEDSREETKLEPFPFKPDPERPKVKSTFGSVPTPKKFVPGEFRESDYESEVESTRIRAKWAPPDSDSEEPYYRKVRAPVFTRSASLPRSYERVATPMEFDREPPVMPTEISKTLDTRHTKQIDLNKFIKKQDNYRKQTTFTNVATSIANSHMSDMSEMFRSKVHRFADDVLTDVKQSKQQKPILKTPQPKSEENNAQAYREESRFAQYGTKHIDPDTGLIYFKYDFGYEFGILFPGQGKRVLADGSSSSTSQQNAMGTRKGDIEVPVIHEKSNGIHQGFNTLPLCKKSQHKNVKWETESEWSDAEEMKHHGWRYEQPTPSPKSLSPSIPSQSPRYFYQPDTSDRSCNSTPASSRLYTTGQNGEIAKPPLFITPLKDIAAVAGQSARFECIVQSEPNPSIVWAKDGRMLQPTLNYETYFRNGVCRLTILKAYPDDAGTYTCTATNCAGAVGCSASLQVPGEKWSTYLRKP